MLTLVLTLDTANGYLIDQYIQDVTNRRMDAYGGSIENRTKFAIEVVAACVSAVGSDRVAIRLSPWSTFLGMGMSDPIPTFTYLIKNLPKGLAYLHGLQFGHLAVLKLILFSCRSWDSGQ